MKGLFKEKMEYVSAHYTTSEGIFEWLTGSFIWGFIVVKYNKQIYDYVFNLLPFSGWLKEYLAYLGFGLILLPLGIIITYILTRIYRMFFNNRRII